MSSTLSGHQKSQNGGHFLSPCFSLMQVASTSQILRYQVFCSHFFLSQSSWGFLDATGHSHSFFTVQHDVNMMLNGSIPRGSGVREKGLLLGSGTPMLRVSSMALYFHQSQGQKQGLSLAILVGRWKHRYLKQPEMPKEHRVSQQLSSRHGLY